MESRELRQRRYDLGLSQAQLAERLGVHTMTVSKWERGVHEIPESVALALGPSPTIHAPHDDFDFVANVKLDDVTEHPAFDFFDLDSASAAPTEYRYRFTVHGRDFVLVSGSEHSEWLVRPATETGGGMTFGDRLTAVYWAIIEAAGAWPAAEGAV